MQRDDEITSSELDDLLGEVESLEIERPAGPTAMRLYVSIDDATLRELQQRAVAAGVDLEAAAAEALRTGARAA